MGARPLNEYALSLGPALELTPKQNFKKWKSTVGDTLSHIKRVVELSSVAIQRTVILLRDLQGLAEMCVQFA